MSPLNILTLEYGTHFNHRTLREVRHPLQPYHARTADRYQFANNSHSKSRECHSQDGPAGRLGVDTRGPQCQANSLGCDASQCTVSPSTLFLHSIIWSQSSGLPAREFPLALLFEKYIRKNRCIQLLVPCLPASAKPSKTTRGATESLPSEI